MGRALILVESLTAALLLVATAAAWAARRRGGLRWGVPVAAVAVVAAPAVILAYLLGVLHQMGTVSLASFVTATGWAAVFLVGSGVVLRAARQAGPDLAVSAARPWSARSAGVAFAIAAVLTAITVSNLDVAVKAQIAAVRVEAGAKALALAQALPGDAPNAAPIYRKAFAALTPQDQLPALLGDRAQAWKSYDRAAFDPSDREQREFLEGQQRGLALLREAAALPHCAFDWTSDTLPMDLPFPDLPHLRHGATLLAYDALARASRGDSRGALDDVAAIFGIVRHVHYPALIALFTAATVEKTGAKALEDLLSLAPPKAEDLARLNAGAGESFRERLRQALAMDEAWGMAAFVAIATGRAGDSADVKALWGPSAFEREVEILSSPLYRIFFLEDDLAAYRRHMRTLRENAALPAPAMIEGFDKQEKSFRTNRGGGILAGLLLPASLNALHATLDADSTRGLVQLAVASTAYKAKHGKYPEKLSELVPEFVPEVPPDPYDGRPMRLRRGKDEFVIYSIGRNRKDDGGRPWDPEKQEGDLVFRLR
jgi:hypothetical protein